MQPYHDSYLHACAHLGFLVSGFLQRLGLTQKIRQDFLGAIAQSTAQNVWFTDHSIRLSLEAIAADMLAPERLQEWLLRYDLPAGKAPKSVGIVMAGNIPLVGFHDLLCVLAVGHRAVVKLSSKDAALLPVLAKYLCQIDYRFASRVAFASELGGVDAVIASGGNNTERYFALRYGQLPHLFRRSRTGVAVLTGGESDEELLALAHDALDYFGLGCRSVGKVFLPQGYDTARLQRSFALLSALRSHAPYSSCCRYAQALLQMRRQPYFDFGSCVATPSSELHPPVGALFLQAYAAPSELQSLLLGCRGELQCIATAAPIEGLAGCCVPLGATQRPGLRDYPDGVDTIQFLRSL